MDYKIYNLIHEAMLIAKDIIRLPDDKILAIIVIASGLIIKISRLYVNLRKYEIKHSNTINGRSNHSK